MIYKKKKKKATCRRRSFLCALFLLFSFFPFSSPTITTTKKKKISSPVRPGGVGDEVVDEHGRRRVGDVAGADDGRELAPDRDAGHADLRDGADAVHKVRLDLSRFVFFFVTGRRGKGKDLEEEKEGKEVRWEKKKEGER